jgi:hypothetical protein
MGLKGTPTWVGGSSAFRGGKLYVPTSGGAIVGGGVMSPKAGAALLGDKQLTRKLERLSTKGSKRAITAGIRAGMTPVAKAMRAAIFASDASPELKREAWRAIGARFGKTRRIQVRHAKVGFAVGKKQKQVRSAGAARGKRIEAGNSGGAGVGISAANIHWFVLGTKKREHKSGRPTGRIANVFGQVTRLALAASTAPMLAAARAKIKQVIEREARKKG